MARNRVLFIVIITAIMLAFLWFQKDQQPPVQRRAEPSAPPATGQQADPAAPEAEPSEPAEAPGRYALPEPPAEDAAIEDVQLVNDSLRLVFTPIGARLKEAYLLINEEAGDVIQLVPQPKDPLAPEYPLALDFTNEDLGRRLNSRVFEWDPRPGGHGGTFSITLTSQKTGAPAVTIRKTYRLDPEQPYVLKTDVVYENHEDAPHRLAYSEEPAFSLLWQPDIATGEESRYMRQAYVWLEDGRYRYVETAKLPKASNDTYSRQPEWIALRSAYFVVALKPDFEDTRAVLTGEPEDLEMRLTRLGVTVEPGQTHTSSFEVYLGPNEDSALAAAWASLPQARRFFQSDTWAFMDWFSKALLGMLNWFHGIIPNYGLAIILLTILVRMALYPLTLKSMRSMKRMQAVAPQMQELREQYKDDPAELNKKMMEMYKEYGVNPLGGCLPMLLQMPVFFALFRMLGSAFELRGANFLLWINDLSQPDRLMELPFLEAIPFVGGFVTAVNVLPVLMGVAMFAQQKFAPTTAVTTPQQKTMMTLMPVIFTAICYNMAAGLSLYILTSTLLGMAQQKLIPAGEVEITPKKRAAAPKKKQHFYNAAQQRKRQMKKEQLKAKRQGGSSASPKGAGKGGSPAKKD